MNASRTRYGRREALELAKDVGTIVASRGTKLVEIDLSRKPSEDELLAVLLGPTGRLRAPTLKVGRTLYVGFPRDGFEGLG